MPFWPHPSFWPVAAALLAALLALATLVVLCWPAKRANEQQSDAAVPLAADTVNRPILGSAEVAAKVYDSAMTNLYAAMLDEAEKALCAAGYSVVTAAEGLHTVKLPEPIREQVSRRVHYMRQQFTSPLEDDDERRARVERDVRDGYPQLMLDELILGWAKAGVYVVAPAAVREVPHRSHEA